MQVFGDAINASENRHYRFSQALFVCSFNHGNDIGIPFQPVSKNNLCPAPQHLNRVFAAPIYNIK